MTFPRQTARVLATALLAAALFPAEAAAYLDPGTGSFFFQILIGTVLTVAVSLRLTWSRLVLFFKGLFQGRRRNDSDRQG